MRPEADQDHQGDHIEGAGPGAEDAIIEADRRRERRRVKSRRQPLSALRIAQTWGEGKIERNADEDERQRMAQQRARRIGQRKRAEDRADAGGERGGGHVRLDLARAGEGEGGGSGAERARELVGRDRCDRIESGERQRRQGQQTTPAGDGVDEAGGEADNSENGENEGGHAGNLRL